MAGFYTHPHAAGQTGCPSGKVADMTHHETGLNLNMGASSKKRGLLVKHSIRTMTTLYRYWGSMKKIIMPREV